MLRRLSTVASIAIIVVFVAVVVAVWIILRGVAAASHLADARADIALLRDDLVNGQPTEADLQRVEADARAAHAETHDPVWWAMSWLPPIHTVRGLTSATNELAENALPSVVSVGLTVEPSKLRVAPNKIALPPLQRAAPALSKAATALETARDDVAGLSSGWGVFGDIRDKALEQLTSLHGSIDDAARFARAGPAMLGADGERRFFVGIQNNAESRATGGLVSGWAIVTANHGRIRVTAHGNDGELQNFIPTRRKAVTSLPADYQDVYGNFLPANHWITSNLSPNFPDAARIWAKMWQAQTGQRIDGVFGVDPFALQAMLGAAGPVTVPGYAGVYDGTNLADYIESKEYVDFAGADPLTNDRRKNFIAEVSTAVIHKLLSGSGDPVAITKALGASAGAGHLALWAANSSEQAELSGTPLAGELPETAAPFAAVHVDNATASKLDYYLDRSFAYQAGQCAGDYRDSTITVRLTNQAPRHGLPPYVRTRGDRDFQGNGTVERVPQNRLFVYIHTTNGAALRRATLGGKTVQVTEGVEHGHPVFGLEVTLDPGQPETIRLRLIEPTTATGPAQTMVQPMARLQQTHVDVPICR
ncbi:MAG: DUF4012 domain-containing protein [Frankiaceae bacterium]|nr:DUF4012 domain-containing protein [Frankiaceae bacterium]MBV9871479.1 DUF4012 domain-containing protein [Frankiaceae bacterium]